MQYSVTSLQGEWKAWRHETGGQQRPPVAQSSTVAPRHRAPSAPSASSVPQKVFDLDARYDSPRVPIPYRAPVSSNRVYFSGHAPLPSHAANGILARQRSSDPPVPSVLLSQPEDWKAKLDSRIGKARSPSRDVTPVRSSSARSGSLQPKKLDSTLRKHAPPKSRSTTLGARGSPKEMLDDRPVASNSVPVKKEAALSPIAQPSSPRTHSPRLTSRNGSAAPAHVDADVQTATSRQPSPLLTRSASSSALLSASPQSSRSYRELSPRSWRKDDFTQTDDLDGRRTTDRSRRVSVAAATDTPPAASSNSSAIIGQSSTAYRDVSSPVTQVQRKKVPRKTSHSVSFSESPIFAPSVSDRSEELNPVQESPGSYVDSPAGSNSRDAHSRNVSRSSPIFRGNSPAHKSTDLSVDHGPTHSSLGSRDGVHDGTPTPRSTSPKAHTRSASNPDSLVSETPNNRTDSPPLNRTVRSASVATPYRNFSPASESGLTPLHDPVRASHDEDGAEISFLNPLRRSVSPTTAVSARATNRPVDIDHDTFSDTSADELLVIEEEDDVMIVEEEDMDVTTLPSRDSGSQFGASPPTRNVRSRSPSPPAGNVRPRSPSPPRQRQGDAKVETSAIPSDLPSDVRQLLERARKQQALSEQHLYRHRKLPSSDSTSEHLTTVYRTDAPQSAESLAPPPLVIEISHRRSPVKQKDWVTPEPPLALAQTAPAVSPKNRRTSSFDSFASSTLPSSSSPVAFVASQRTVSSAPSSATQSPERQKAPPARAAPAPSVQSRVPDQQKVNGPVAKSLPAKGAVEMGPLHQPRLDNRSPERQAKVATVSLASVLMPKTDASCSAVLSTSASSTTGHQPSVNASKTPSPSTPRLKSLASTGHHASTTFRTPVREPRVDSPVVLSARKILASERARQGASPVSPLALMSASSPRTNGRRQEAAARLPSALLQLDDIYIPASEEGSLFDTGVKFTDGPCGGMPVLSQFLIVPDPRAPFEVVRPAAASLPIPPLEEEQIKKFALKHVFEAAAHLPDVNI